MSVTTYAGVVENGQIRLPEDVRLPEHTTVYIVVPEASAPVRIMSPRLMHPEQANDFEMKVVKEP